MADLIFIILFSLVLGFLTMLCSVKMFQIFQLSGYNAKGVVNWFKSDKFNYLARYFALAFIGFICMFVYIACFDEISPKGVEYLGALIFVALMILFVVFNAKVQKKTPLVITPRIIRLAIVTFLISTLLTFAFVKLGNIGFLKYSIASVVVFLIPIIVTLANYSLLPFEILNNNGYKSNAIRCLQSYPHLIKIGITGSYGKTTSKNILAKMLSKKYNVCFSPSSYNTPMGISRVVNNDLKMEHEIFIAEMGARNKGDIEELAKMINPNYGLITCIGEQHLETFGDINNIMDTKFELIENMAIGGLAVFNGDNKYCVDLYNRATTEKLITGTSDVEKAVVTYSDIETTSTGTKMTLHYKKDSVTFTTKLLGKHIAGLIAVCAGIAVSLDITLQQIKEACEELDSVPHRLELIDNGDVKVIDDAYNSNREGARNALEILSKFEGTKIIVTPGFVEMGALEKEANVELGMQIAEFADVAVLIGTRADDIKSGAISANMDEDKIIIKNSLKEAVDYTTTLQGKKTILFENDLPDNYK